MFNCFSQFFLSIQLIQQEFVCLFNMTSRIIWVNSKANAPKRFFGYQLPFFRQIFCVITTIYIICIYILANTASGKSDKNWQCRWSLYYLVPLQCAKLLLGISFSKHLDNNGAIGTREAKSAFFTDCVKNALFAPQYPHSELRYGTKI